jgi:phage terminase large subunit-like protein
MRHGGDAVLNWCASNVVPRYDDNMNMSPDRKRSADKIDDAVALFMAVGAMGVAEPPPKKFQLLFV